MTTKIDQMNDETAGSQIKYWFLVMSKMFCLRKQLQSLSLEYCQAGDCAPLSPERCLQESTSALYRGFVLSDTVEYIWHLWHLNGDRQPLEGPLLSTVALPLAAPTISTCFDCFNPHRASKESELGWTWSQLMRVTSIDFMVWHDMV